MRTIYFVCLIVLMAPAIFPQNRYRGSIPEELLRPGKGEVPRYPIDTVIGELGQGTASNAAFLFANRIAEGLVSGRMGHPALASISSSRRESYLSALGSIVPVHYRIGGGRVEPDGATSFLVRFIGREYGITAEMYIRYVTIQRDGGAQGGNWVLEDLLLDEAKSRDQEERSSLHRIDYIPYERFF